MSIRKIYFGLSILTSLSFVAPSATRMQNISFVSPQTNCFVDLLVHSSTFRVFDLKVPLK